MIIFRIKNNILRASLNFSCLYGRLELCNGLQARLANTLEWV